MNILYIHQYFVTPKGFTGTRSYWNCKELINRGHNVTVISATSNEYPEACTVYIDGIKVIYVKNEYNNYMSVMRKIYSFVHFITQAIYEAKKLNDIDMVYATSTPLTIGYIAMRIKFSKGWPYVFEVRDLWPEFPIQIGAIKNPLVIKILRSLEKRIYQMAEHVVALSPGMQEGVIAAGTPKEKTSMIPNMSKPDKFFPHEPNMNIVEKYNLDLKKFNVVHFGSMGRANGLQYITRAAKILKDMGDSSINFVFIGDGATCPLLKEEANNWSLDNVQFLGFQPMNIVSEVVNCCDASITTFLNLPILKTNSPNKLFDSLSAGKPIIVNSAGWTKDLVEQENCGFFVDPEKPQELAVKLLKIKEDKELLKIWSENARKLSLEVYDKNILTAQVANVIENAYKKRVKK